MQEELNKRIEGYIENWIGSMCDMNAEFVSGVIYGLRLAQGICVNPNLEAYVKEGGCVENRVD